MDIKQSVWIMSVKNRRDINMKGKICQDCRKEFGPTIVYLISYIHDMDIDEKDKRGLAMKNKWLYFFDANMDKLDTEERLKKA